MDTLCANRHHRYILPVTHVILPTQIEGSLQHHVINGNAMKCISNCGFIMSIVKRQMNIVQYHLSLISSLNCISCKDNMNIPWWLYNWHKWFSRRCNLAIHTPFAVVIVVIFISRKEKRCIYLHNFLPNNMPRRGRLSYIMPSEVWNKLYSDLKHIHISCYIAVILIL